MTVKRQLTRLTFVAGLTAATVALVTPAHAADEIRFAVSNLASTLTAGAAPTTFNGTMTNRSDTGYRSVRRIFVISLPGLSAGDVLLAKMVAGQQIPLPSVAAGDGRVQVVDELPPSALPRRSTVRAIYALAFTAGAPVGRATILMQGYDGGVLLGESAPRTITVKSMVVPSPSPSRATTNTAAATTAAAAAPTGAPTLPTTETEVIADGTDQASPAGGGGVSWVFYLLGGVLVAGGGGLIYWVWRRPATVDDDDGQYAGPGGVLSSPTVLLPADVPTAPLPAVPARSRPAQSPAQSPQVPRPPWRQA